MFAPLIRTPLTPTRHLNAQIDPAVFGSTPFRRCSVRSGSLPVSILLLVLVVGLVEGYGQGSPTEAQPPSPPADTTPSSTPPTPPTTPERSSPGPLESNDPHRPDERVESEPSRFAARSDELARLERMRRQPPRIVRADHFGVFEVQTNRLTGWSRFTIAHPGGDWPDRVDLPLPGWSWPVLAVEPPGALVVDDQGGHRLRIRSSGQQVVILHWIAPSTAFVAEDRVEFQLAALEIRPQRLTLRLPQEIEPILASSLSASASSVEAGEASLKSLGEPNANAAIGSAETMTIGPTLRRARLGDAAVEPQGSQSNAASSSDVTTRDWVVEGVQSGVTIRLRRTDAAPPAPWLRGDLGGPIRVAILGSQARVVADWVWNPGPTPTDRLMLELDPRLEVLQVVAEGLRETATSLIDPAAGTSPDVATNPERANVKQLELRFTEAPRQPVYLKVEAALAVETGRAWPLPWIRPTSQTWRSGRITVGLDASRVVASCRLERGRLLPSVPTANDPTALPFPGAAAILEFEPHGPGSVAALVLEPARACSEPSLTIQGQIWVDRAGIAPTFVATLAIDPANRHVEPWVVGLSPGWKVISVRSGSSERPTAWRIEPASETDGGDRVIAARVRNDLGATEPLKIQARWVGQGLPPAATTQESRRVVGGTTRRRFELPRLRPRQAIVALDQWVVWSRDGIHVRPDLSTVAHPDASEQLAWRTPPNPVGLAQGLKSDLAWTWLDERLAPQGDHPPPPRPAAWIDDTLDNPQTHALHLYRFEANQVHLTVRALTQGAARVTLLMSGCDPHDPSFAPSWTVEPLDEADPSGMSFAAPLIPRVRLWNLREIVVAWPRISGAIQLWRPFISTDIDPRAQTAASSQATALVAVVDLPEGRRPARLTLNLSLPWSGDGAPPSVCFLQRRAGLDRLAVALSDDLDLDWQPQPDWIEVAPSLGDAWFAELDPSPSAIAPPTSYAAARAFLVDVSATRGHVTTHRNQPVTATGLIQQARVTVSKMARGPVRHDLTLMLVEPALPNDSTTRTVGLEIGLPKDARLLGAELEGQPLTPLGLDHASGDDPADFNRWRFDWTPQPQRTPRRLLTIAYERPSVDWSPTRPAWPFDWAETTSSPRVELVRPLVSWTCLEWTWEVVRPSSWRLSAWEGRGVKLDRLDRSPPPVVSAEPRGRLGGEPTITIQQPRWSVEDRKLLILENPRPDGPRPTIGLGDLLERLDRPDRPVLIDRAAFDRLALAPETLVTLGEHPNDIFKSLHLVALEVGDALWLTERPRADGSRSSPPGDSGVLSDSGHHAKSSSKWWLRQTIGLGWEAASSFDAMEFLRSRFDPVNLAEAIREARVWGWDSARRIASVTAWKRFAADPSSQGSPQHGFGVEEEGSTHCDRFTASAWPARVRLTYHDNRVALPLTLGIATLVAATLSLMIRRGWPILWAALVGMSVLILGSAAIRPDLVDGLVPGLFLGGSVLLALVVGRGLGRRIAGIARAWRHPRRGGSSMARTLTPSGRGFGRGGTAWLLAATLAVGGGAGIGPLRGSALDPPEAASASSPQSGPPRAFVRVARGDDERDSSWVAQTRAWINHWLPAPVAAVAIHHYLDPPDPNLDSDAPRPTPLVRVRTIWTLQVERGRVQSWSFPLQGALEPRARLNGEPVPIEIRSGGQEGRVWITPDPAVGSDPLPPESLPPQSDRFETIELILERLAVDPSQRLAITPAALARGVVAEGLGLALVPAPPMPFTPSPTLLAGGEHLPPPVGVPLGARTVLQWRWLDSKTTGDLSPPNVNLTNPATAAPEANRLNASWDILALWDAEPGGDLVRMRLTPRNLPPPNDGTAPAGTDLASASPYASLTLTVPPDLSLRQARGPGRVLFQSDGPRRTRLEFQPPPKPGQVVELIWRRSAALAPASSAPDPNANTDVKPSASPTRRFPALDLEGLGSVSGAVALRRPPGWEDDFRRRFQSPPPGQDPERGMSDAEFNRRWQELPQDGMTLAGAARFDSWSELTGIEVRVAPPEPVTLGEATVRLEAEPGRLRFRMLLEPDLLGRPTLIEPGLALPPESRIVSVSGGRLVSWRRSRPDRLTLVTRSPSDPRSAGRSDDIPPSPNPVSGESASVVVEGWLPIPPTLAQPLRIVAPWPRTAGRESLSATGTIELASARDLILEPASHGDATASNETAQNAPTTSPLPTGRSPLRLTIKADAPPPELVLKSPPPKVRAVTEQAAVSGLNADGVLVQMRVSAPGRALNGIVVSLDAPSEAAGSPRIKPSVAGAFNLVALKPEEARAWGIANRPAWWLIPSEPVWAEWNTHVQILASLDATRFRFERPLPTLRIDAVGWSASGDGSDGVDGWITGEAIQRETDLSWTDATGGGVIVVDQRDWTETTTRRTTVSQFAVAPAGRVDRQLRTSSPEARLVLRGLDSLTEPDGHTIQRLLARVADPRLDPLTEFGLPSVVGVTRIWPAPATGPRAADPIWITPPARARLLAVTRDGHSAVIQTRPSQRWRLPAAGRRREVWELVWTAPASRLDPQLLVPPTDTNAPTAPAAVWGLRLPQLSRGDRPLPWMVWLDAEPPALVPTLGTRHARVTLRAFPEFQADRLERLIASAAASPTWEHRSSWDCDFQDHRRDLVTALRVWNTPDTPLPLRILTQRLTQGLDQWRIESFGASETPTLPAPPPTTANSSPKTPQPDLAPASSPDPRRPVARLHAIEPPRGGRGVWAIDHAATTEQANEPPAFDAITAAPTHLDLEAYWIRDDQRLETRATSTTGEDLRDNLQERLAAPVAVVGAIAVLVGLALASAGTTTPSPSRRGSGLEAAHAASHAPSSPTSPNAGLAARLEGYRRSWESWWLADRDTRTLRLASWLATLIWWSWTLWLNPVVLLLIPPALLVGPLAARAKST